jgi:hypothetical protein
MPGGAGIPAGASVAQLSGRRGPAGVGGGLAVEQSAATESGVPVDDGEPEAGALEPLQAETAAASRTAQARRRGMSPFCPRRQRPDRRRPDGTMRT